MAPEPLPVAEPDDAYTAMLRGALIPTLVAAAIGVGVGALAGWPGVLGALVGAGLVIVFFTIGLLVMRRTARLRPDAVMGVVMITYVVKVAVLAVLLVLLKDVSWMSSRHFALTALLCTVVWLTFEVRAFTRMRIFHVDPGTNGTTGEGR